MELVFFSFSLFTFVLNVPVFNHLSTSTVFNETVHASFWHQHNMCIRLSLYS